ncbi:Sugar phosphate isomerase/epimerase [Prosthecobacter debontii]|uniref:Sugar phosphate isomerase/epimerase n=1 Tax=Prosthecobacter debontii TaxID=48467 RepID=A0A1T4YPE6_9BACT|nr:TIM barrel protein [Prosthecobacter debontii]SKB03639.1 Sugar phosphate isomerase/epimerase [Prosthecobacter debontii]
MDRRSFLASLLSTAASWSGSAALGRARLGLTTASYTQRWLGKYSSFKVPPFGNVLDLMDHVRGLGVGSVQVPIDSWTQDLARRVRQTCESYGMEVEGSVRLPMVDADLGRFEREMRTAKEAGIRILRSALGGRRYEQFRLREDYLGWKDRALQAMQRAEPLTQRLQMKIGIENHKDWEVEELLEALTTVSSEAMGACVDFGNSLALLEEPLKVVQALAPYAVTAHLKDMAVNLCEDGFEMTEVPLGQGSLDLARMIAGLVKGQPDIRLHLEMITRHPLEIPCLTEAYWATFAAKSGVDLARTLTWVRQQSQRTLPRVSGMSKLAILEKEEANIDWSIQYALKCCF